MTAIWIVSSGEYSAYTVHCAFTTEELAVEYAAHRSKLTVEEYKTLVKFWDDHRGPEYWDAVKKLSEPMQAANWEQWRVEVRDLFDSMPVLDPQAYDPPDPEYGQVPV